MSYSVQRGIVKKTGRHIATLVERVETQDGPFQVVVMSAEGANEIEAAVSLDVAIQSVQAITKMACMAARDRAEERERAEEAIKALVTAQGDQSEPEGNN